MTIVGGHAPGSTTMAGVMPHGPLLHSKVAPEEASGRMQVLTQLGLGLGLGLGLAEEASGRMQVLTLTLALALTLTVILP